MYLMPATAALLAACTTVAEPRADGWAAIGEPTRAGSLTVTPIELLEDSRCAQGVQCVWAGRIVVRTRIEDGSMRVADIVIGEEIRIRDGLLELDRVEPAAVEGVDSAPEDYRFHYRYAPMIMEQ